MKTFSIVTLFLLVFLFVLQCFVLDYFIIYSSGIVLVLVPIMDTALLLYMLASYNVEFAATTGGVIWLLYSWLLLGKIIYFFFFVLNNADLRSRFDSEAIIGVVGINISLYFTPILYSILSFRSRIQLYGPSKHTISIMTMLHADMVVHVMLDLLDLMVAFNYASLPDPIARENEWLRIFIGVFLSVAIFMHSYSFPTSAGSNDSRSQTHQGDVFLTRRHAALVAMFLVDVPLLFVRLYLWVNYPSVPGFDPLLVKNITFLPLQAFRLNQCRLAEREKTLNSQKNYFVEDSETRALDAGADNATSIGPPPRTPSHQMPKYPGTAAMGGGSPSQPTTQLNPLSRSASNPAALSPSSNSRRRRVTTSSHGGAPTALKLQRGSMADIKAAKGAGGRSRPVGSGGTAPASGQPSKSLARSFSALFRNTPKPTSTQQTALGRRDSTLGNNATASPSEDNMTPFAAGFVGSRHATSTVGFRPDTSGFPQSTRAGTRRALAQLDEDDIDEADIDPNLVDRSPSVVAGGGNVNAVQFARGGLDPSLITRVDEDIKGSKGRKQVERIISDLKSVREVPVRGFKLSEVLNKIYQSLRIGGLHGLSTILDDNFILSYWKKVRLALPIILAWGSQIALVGVGCTKASDEGKPFRLSQVKSFQDIPRDIFISYCVSLGGMIGMMLIWIGSAPILDVLFVSLFWGVRLTSWYTTFHIVRDTRALQTSQWNIGDVQWIVLLVVFGLKPIIQLLNSLFSLQSAILGREHMFFVVKGANRKIREAMTSTATKFEDNTLDDEHTQTRHDESGWVTTSSMLVFKNVRHFLAPISYGELLVGPDLIKAIRLLDSLILRAWLEILFIFWLKFASLCLCYDWAFLTIFGVHIAFCLVYAIFGQAVRLLALRRYEMKALFEDIVKAWNDFEERAAQDALMNGELSGANKAEVRKPYGSEPRRFLTVSDLMEKYRRQGFFTSPGDIFPIGL